ncbi:MAG TPA: hypothetical protein VL986_11085 [Terracidiphilus sp.]|nr:hypothetical protein [Terracidiphilus sp.]
MTLPTTVSQEQQDQNPGRTSECVYQFITLAAMLVVLATLWVF